MVGVGGGLVATEDIPSTCATVLKITTFVKRKKLKGTKSPQNQSQTGNLSREV